MMIFSFTLLPSPKTCHARTAHIRRFRWHSARFRRRMRFSRVINVCAQMPSPHIISISMQVTGDGMLYRRSQSMQQSFSPSVILMMML